MNGAYCTSTRCGQGWLLGHECPVSGDPGVSAVGDRFERKSHSCTSWICWLPQSADRAQASEPQGGRPSHLFSIAQCQQTSIAPNHGHFLLTCCWSQPLTLRGIQSELSSVKHIQFTPLCISRLRHKCHAGVLCLSSCFHQCNIP